jgi:hypothetical protein
LQQQDSLAITHGRGRGKACPPLLLLHPSCPRPNL